MSYIEKRISEIALRHCSDYPNIATIETWEKLYAIECTIEGTNMAIEDWNMLAKHLAKMLYGENYQELLLAEWDALTKKVGKVAGIGVDKS